MKSQEKLPRAMADYGKRFEQGLEQMSPFEIKNDLISYAKECDQKAVCQFLNAGRGNPNWINTVAREAFLLSKKQNSHLNFPKKVSPECLKKKK